MRSFNPCPRLLVWSVCTCATVFSIASAHAQFGDSPSFGSLNKKAVPLQSKLPALYDARGKTVAVQAQDAMLKIAIEKQLTQSDSSIHVGGTDPDLIIECSISQNHAVRSVNKVETKSESSTSMIGDLSVIFRIWEPRTKLIVKSDMATAKVDEVVSRTTQAMAARKVFGVNVPGTGANTIPVKGSFPSVAEAQNYLVADVARKIATYVVNTDVTIQVPLAVGGALNGPDKFAESGLWSRDLEALEEMPHYSDAKSEAYRLYDVGVANEALAYQAQDTKSAMKFLEEASNDYGKALDAKQDEKSFLESQTRIKAALEHYEDIGKTTPMSSEAPLKTSIGGGTPPVADGALKNQDVIDMVKAHMDEANIIDTIQNAPAVNFDISAQGQIRLSKEGVNGKVLMAMKNRARGTGVTSQRR
jgi:hypothetical protein